MSTHLISTLWTLSEPLVNSYNCELIDIEYVKEGQTFFLRFYIDKDGGVNLDDCQNISRALDPLLDSWESEKKIKFSQAYHLEVSSPGLNRPLKRERDFLRNKGNLIEINLYKPFMDKKKYEGVLLNYDEQSQDIELLVDEERSLTINRSEIAKARKIDLI